MRSKVIKFIQTESRMVVTRGWGKGKREFVILMDMSFKFAR